MRLKAPITGNFVEAEGEAAELLIAAGYEREPEKKKAAPRKRAAAKKEQ